MSLIDYTPEQIKKLINDGLCDVKTLRDYDIVKASMEGKKVNEIADNNSISREQVWRIKQKYMRK